MIDLTLIYLFIYLRLKTNVWPLLYILFGIFIFPSSTFLSIFFPNITCFLYLHDIFYGLLIYTFQGSNKTPGPVQETRIFSHRCTAPQAAHMPQMSGRCSLDHASGKAVLGRPASVIGALVRTLRRPRGCLNTRVHP